MLPTEKYSKNWVSLSEAAPSTPYSAEYLSLLARKGKLLARKVDNVWYTTESALNDYVRKQVARTRLQNGNRNFVNLAQSLHINEISSLRSLALPTRPQTSKTRAWSKTFLKKTVVVSLALILTLGLGLSVLEKSSPTLASLLKNRIADTTEFAHSQLAGSFSVSGLRDFFSKIFFTPDSPKITYTTPPAPTPPSTPLAITSVTQELNLGSLKSSLKSELESYVLAQIKSASSPVVIYSTSPQLSSVDFDAFKTNDIVPEIHYHITNQSDSDADRLSSRLNTLTTDGQFVKATFDTICFSGDTCETSWPSGGSGDAFPFTATSYGVSTSTTIGFLNGFLSTASSTIDSTLLVTGSTNLQNLIFANATGTSATTTNFFSATASSTNLFAQNGNIGALTVTSCIGCGSTFSFTPTTYGVSTSTTIGLLNGFLSTASSTLQNFTFSNATGTNATTTNNLFSSIFSGNSLSIGGSATSTINSSGDLLVMGSTTLQRFTASHSTTTHATTTNFFSATASSTNLYTALFNGAGLATCQTNNVLTWSGGTFGCEADDSGSGFGKTWEINPLGYLAPTTTQSVIVGATSSPRHALFQVTATGTTGDLINASSTLSFTGNFLRFLTSTASEVFKVASDGATTIAGVLTLSNNLVFDSETFDSLTDDATLANNSGDLQVVDVTCTDCLNATEIEDLYLLIAGDTSAGNFTWSGAHTFDNITRSTSTQATSTNTFSSIFSGNSLSIGGSATSTINSSGDLLVMGSTTLQRFTASHSTTTHATTTNFFSATASSTNLYTALFNGAGLATCQTNNVLTWSGGTFGCEADDSGSGFGKTWEINPLGYLAPTTTQSVIVGATSSPRHALFQVTATGTTGDLINASSTLSFTGNFLRFLTSTASEVFKVASDGATTIAGVLTLSNNLVFDSETFDSLTDDATLANNSGDLQVVDVTCTDCLNATEIEDLYLLIAGDTSAGNFTWSGAHTFDNITRSTSTQATSTNTFSSIFSGNSLSIGGSATSTINSSGDLLVMGSTTLQRFTASHSTTTHATTTNFFSATASSTNLYTALFNGAGLATCQTNNVLTWSGGTFGCEADDSGSGAPDTKFATTTSTLNPNAIFPNAGNNTLLGLGTSTPMYQLTIASSTGSQLSLSDAAGFSQWAFRNAGGNFYLATTTVAGTATTTLSALTIIGSTGNVGIGDATPAGRLQVNTVANAGSERTSMVFSSPDYGTTVGDSLSLVWGSFQDDVLAKITNSVILENGVASTPLSFSTLYNTTLSEKLRITGLGNVGIGTTTPTWLLNPASSTASQLALSSGAGFSQWAFRNAGGNLYFATTTLAGTATSSVSALSINANGQVLVGNRGSITVPAYSFAEDPDTGVYGDGSGGVNFTNNGNLNWSINSAGALASVSSGGRLKVAGGSDVSSPDIQSNVDTNTGIAFSNDERIMFVSNGAEVARFTSLGGLGIGTSTPAWQLQISSSTKSQLTLSDPSVLTNNHWSFRNAGGLFYIATSSASTFATSSTVALSIDSTNTVTFGNANATCIALTGHAGLCDGNDASGGASTYDAWTHPSFGLSATTSQMLFGTTTASNFGVTMSSSTAPQLSLSAGAGFGQWAFRNAEGNFYLATTTVAGTATTSSSALSIIGSSGKVGIGTSSPSSHLTVDNFRDGAVVMNVTNMSNTSGASAGYVAYTGQASGGFSVTPANYALAHFASRFNMGISSGGGVDVLSATGDIRFYTNGTDTSNERMRIDTYGGIGIGTTTPYYGLTLASTTAPQLSLSAGAGFSQWAFRNAGGNFYLATTTVAGTATSSVSALSIIGSSGNVGIGTTSPWGLLSVNPDRISGPSFVVGSSTATYLVVNGGGNVGIGSTTPWAKLSIIGNGNTPTFVVATTSNWNSSGSQVPLIFATATTTQGVMDFARVGIGTSTAPWAATGNTALRDTLTVAGRIYTTWRYLSCDIAGASSATLSADDSGACGDFMFDEVSAGLFQANLVQNTTVPFATLRGSDTPAIAETSAIRTSGLIASASSSPVMEVLARHPGGASQATNTINIIGFTNVLEDAAIYSNSSVDGIYFAASSTANWQAIVRKGSVESRIDTTVPTTTAALPFQRFRIEVSSSTVIFLINGAVVAVHTAASTNNIPNANLAAVVSNGENNTGTAGADREIYLSLMRVMVDDPRGRGGGRGGPVEFSEAPFDAVQGADIAEAYLTDDITKFKEGMLVSEDAMAKVSLPETPYHKGLLGVVSTSPHTVMGTETSSTTRVALLGRAPTVVSLESGAIKVGDRITSSSVEGIGAKARRPGYVVGHALQNWDPENGIGICDLELANIGAETPVTEVTPDDPNCRAKILMRVETGFDMGIGNVIQDAGATFADIASAMNELANEAFTSGAELTKAVFGQIIAKVAVVADLFAKNIFTENITTKKLCLEDVCVTKTELQALLNGQNTPPPTGGGSAPPDESELPPEPPPPEPEPEPEQSPPPEEPPPIPESPPESPPPPAPEPEPEIQPPPVPSEVEGEPSPPPPEPDP